MLGCAFTYQAPTTTAPEVSVSFRNSKAAIFKAAQQVLVTEGYQITYANEAAGTISTAPQNLRVTDEQADCGTNLGMTYLLDPRTKMQVAFGVIVEESKLTVRANIQGEFKPGGKSGMANVIFTCVSRGTLEKSLLDKIMAAAGLK